MKHRQNNGSRALLRMSIAALPVTAITIAIAFSLPSENEAQENAVEAQKAAAREPTVAAVPLPYVTVNSMSAYDMIDGLGVNTGISYQIGASNPWDLPNRDGEKEFIRALKYLGIHHIRNQGLDDNPQENAVTAYPNAPSDFENLLTVLGAIPNLKMDYVINATGADNWNENTRRVLRKLARLGVLASIEAPNEPNNQQTHSPDGEKYPTDILAFNRIWSDWGAALLQFKKSDTIFANVLLLPPSSAVQGPNDPDGVEATYKRSGLTDHTAFFDLMNLHSYARQEGSSLGDPQGPIENGNAPNDGSYQISIANWGRYAMPHRRAIVTESGATTGKLSEQAQGLVLVNNFFWARYYNAVRIYQYALVDDSSNPMDLKAERWGFYRGNWSAKPGAHFVHNFTSVLADAAQSDPTTIPHFTVAGPRKATWGATMAFSKSDGSYVIACNNVLPWWNTKSGKDASPAPELWKIELERESSYRIMDVKTGEFSSPKKGQSLSISVRGYPMLILVRP
jgi:hypothetical protein